MSRQTDGPTDRRTDRADWGPRALATLRRVFGMPDYAGYVEHLRLKHPGCAVPTEQEFFDQYVTARYSGGPTRCC